MAAGEMVTIGCKHPNGVVLNTDRMIAINDKGDVRREPGKSIFLRGWSHEFNKPDPAAETGGYVLTRVPADFWEEWLGMHKDFPMLKDLTILPPHKDAGAQARDFADVPKMFAPTSGEMKTIEQSRLAKD